MFGYDDLSREALEAQLFEARLALLESNAAGGDLQARLQALGCFGSWVWLPESNQLWWSAALYRLRDVEPTGMLTFEAYRALVHPDDRARVSAELSHALSTRTPFKYLERVRRRDGTVRWFRNTGEVTGGAGETLRVSAFCQDVTPEYEAAELALTRSADLERANEELQVQSEELQVQSDALASQSGVIEQQRAVLESLVSHAPAGIAYLDGALSARWMNPVIRRLLARHDERTFGSRGAATESGATFERLARQALGENRPAFVQGLAWADADGAVSHWDASFVPLVGGTGEADGVLVFVLDVSEREGREAAQKTHIAQLEQVDRVKDEFLAVLSHELRTPLNAILGFSSILEDEVQGTLNAAQHESLTKIVGGADRMVRLVEDLLEIARIRAGKLHILPGATCLAEVVTDVVCSLALLAEAGGLDLSTDVPVDLVGYFDAGRVGQVLTNLVGNAIKFTPPGGHVWVSARGDGDHLRVWVRDDGPGIPEDAARRIFGKFEQLDMSATRAKNGVGLGLAIAQGLVEAQNGAIGVERPAEGGAAFWFTLPLAAPSRAIAAG